MKIIASDYDGTFHRHHGVEQKDREAVRKWRESGNLFGVVTGRPTEMLDIIVKERLELDFVITYNGVDVYDLSGEQPALVKRLSGKSDRFYELSPLILRKSGDWAEFITPDGNYYVTYNDETVHMRDHHVKREALKNINEFIQIYALYKTEDEALEIARQLNEGFSEAVSPLVNGSWLNVAPSGVTKASGVWEYAKLRSAAKEDIFTIGDSYNDLDMIQKFNGYTVENGAEAIKKAALGICKGVWELIENSL